MEIIEKIKEKQKKVGMTDYKLANLSGINKSTLCRIGKGEIKNITLKTLQDLCQVLDIEIILKDK
jgi:DNA-binding Xre family transcriptional regulator